MLCREPECKGVAAERIQDKIVLIPIVSLGHAFNHLINTPQHIYTQLQRLILDTLLINATEIRGSHDADTTIQ